MGLLAYSTYNQGLIKKIIIVMPPAPVRTPAHGRFQIVVVAPVVVGTVGGASPSPSFVGSGAAVVKDVVSSAAVVKEAGPVSGVSVVSGAKGRSRSIGSTSYTDVVSFEADLQRSIPFVGRSLGSSKQREATPVSVTKPL